MAYRLIDRLMFDGMSFDEFFNAFGYDSEMAWKPASRYLNIFNSRTMKPGEKQAKYCRELEVLLNKAIPGLQEKFKEQLLKDKVIKSVAATKKLFLELVLDKKWNEIVAQCEKRVINKLEIGLDVDWEQEQSKDDELTLVKLAVKTGDKSGLAELTNGTTWEKQHGGLCIQDDLLCYKYQLGNTTILVPKHLTEQIFKLYHDSITAGHLGFEKIFITIPSRFYRLKMKEEIYDYCHTCDTC
ncbi:Transposon Ty3-G Gag-Pol poly [Brachionus plicatilis]|uniref:Transposon Ty3-G Gag-Pol poly n=1 Tax=Brachionus plicatilis TaxID=10195 RepID=A0A3M7R9S3_BRAPC|nr:Transposon Ty3-G Gag-Pol poly [Brachionus plicatilis]